MNNHTKQLLHTYQLLSFFFSCKVPIQFFCPFLGWELFYLMSGNYLYLKLIVYQIHILQMFGWLWIAFSLFVMS